MMEIRIDDCDVRAVIEADIHERIMAISDNRVSEVYFEMDGKRIDSKNLKAVAVLGGSMKDSD